MKVNLKYCTVAAIIVVVLFSVTAGYVINSGQASYTAAPETWYWTAFGNVTYAVVSGTWVHSSSSSCCEEGIVYTNTGGSILIPIYVVNPNPTLILKSSKKTTDGFFLLYDDGARATESDLIANVSLFGSDTYNEITRISTNFTRGYHTMNISIGQNGTQDDLYIQAMWLE